MKKGYSTNNKKPVLDLIINMFLLLFVYFIQFQDGFVSIKNHKFLFLFFFKNSSFYLHNILRREEFSSVYDFKLNTKTSRKLKPVIECILKGSEYETLTLCWPIGNRHDLSFS